MLSLLVAIDEPRKELDDSITSHEKSQVYEEIAAKYPEDLEVVMPVIDFSILAYSCSVSFVCLHLAQAHRKQV